MRVLLDECDSTESQMLQNRHVGYTTKQGETKIRTVEAIIDEQGNVRLLEPLQLPSARRALVTILEEQPATGALESALLSEAALAEDWNRPEEDQAWSHLSQVR